MQKYFPFKSVCRKAFPEIAQPKSLKSLMVSLYLHLQYQKGSLVNLLLKEFYNF